MEQRGACQYLTRLVLLHVVFGRGAMWSILVQITDIILTKLGATPGIIVHIKTGFYQPHLERPPHPPAIPQMVQTY